ncbi:MAG: glycyl-radical enzyme activating protein [Clostridium sp.]|uniref:glycyl-radical enzyme activating protein n=1 Tax=Clostridium sp. TaxID=1506 RepID=UPI0025E6C7C3|nr:glycyl-radical enzyme activating protein [Clostridium sp.]MCI6691571.1 glycyl-radical enzyme activating protein [Clostridium sp.]MDY2632445.1 glycyl-radical enzyme activating protein [Clostridium sp.]
MISKNIENDYLNIKGRIFDIQKFSVHDGPGIRTIIFLKGCFFRCRWCCNPESQNFEIEKMKVNGKIKSIGEDITVKEVLSEIEKDRAYYRRSGGGVTLSGGECLFQPDFAYGILKGCKELGINTAIETTACTNFSVIERILPEVDYVLMDIKHINPIKHKEYIGSDNSLVLENAKKISNFGSNLTIRVPVIPGFNDTEKEILDIAKFTKNLKGVKEIHLLPYHRLGRDKYTGLNRDYLLDSIEPPSEEKMKKLQQVVNNIGISGKIGG